jgi:diguanylate cyclase (GGDEF)-like protein
MKTVHDLLRRAPVWVDPDHTAETAIILMRGHGIGGLPVLASGKLVGMVLYSSLLGVDPRQRVRDVMTVGVPTVTPDMSAREAAQVLAESGVGRVSVVEGDRLVGVITSNDLLPELGRSFDPLTGLPWADSLRQWAIAQLQEGHEITVLFIDLDQFGQFNKVYGHIVGDEVLRSVSAILRELTTPDTDHVCRYGGDEFCIGTLRRYQDASELARRVEAGVAGIRLEAIGSQQVTCSVGQRGGRRTREREDVHFAATVDNLINLASRDCTDHKRAAAPAGDVAVASEGPPGEPRLRLAGATVQWDGRAATIQVSLQLQGGRGADPRQGALMLEGVTYYTATVSTPADKGGLVRVVAETTIEAVRRVLPAGYSVNLCDVFEARPQSGQTLVTAVAEWVSPLDRFPTAGSAIVGADPHQAAARAVLACVNRPLGPLLARR